LAGLSFHFTKGPSQTVPRCYFDDGERVHLCRERGQGSRVLNLDQFYYRDYFN
jgi:hypothetical protein